MAFDPSSLLGWLGQDDTQRALAAQVPSLANAAPWLYEADDDKSPILLYKANIEVWGKWIDYAAQTIGDCVSHGWGHGIDMLQCIEIALDGAGEYRETCTELIYGGSREIANILGPFDGSYGGAAAKFCTQVGNASREMLGAEGTYSGQRAKKWGRSGPPDDLKDKAGAYKLGAAAQVNTWDDLVAAIKSAHPVPVCCGWFGQGQRDSDGFIQGYGRGGHCQLICGVRFDKPGACWLNSWPPSAYSGPRPMDMAQQMYWVPKDRTERALREGDTFAISAMPYFKKRDVPKDWRWSDMA